MKSNELVNDELVMVIESWGKLCFLTNYEGRSDKHLLKLIGCCLETQNSHSWFEPVQYFMTVFVVLLNLDLKIYYWIWSTGCYKDGNGLYIAHAVAYLHVDSGSPGQSFSVISAHQTSCSMINMLPQLYNIQIYFQKAKPTWMIGWQQQYIFHLSA